MGRKVVNQTRRISPKITLAALLELDFRSFVLSERFSQLHNRRVFTGACGKPAQRCVYRKKPLSRSALCSPNCNVAFCSADGGQCVGEREGDN